MELMCNFFINSMMNSLNLQVLVRRKHLFEQIAKSNKEFKKGNIFKVHRKLLEKR